MEEKDKGKEKDKDKIEDFGEYIVGAKKELAMLNRGLTLDDIKNWSDAEREELITKGTVFPKPDYQQMKDNGVPIKVIYFIKKVYDTLPPAPTDATPQEQERYINYMSWFQRTLPNLRAEQDAWNYKYFVEMDSGFLTGCPAVVTNASRYLFNEKTRKVLDYNDQKITDGIANSKFLYSDEEKEYSKYIIFQYDGKNAYRIDPNTVEIDMNDGLGTRHKVSSREIDTRLWAEGRFVVINKKDAFIRSTFDTEEEAKEFILSRQNIAPKTPTTQKKNGLPPSLQYITRRSCEDFRNNEDISGDDLMERYGFRGGQFGNWENQAERQENLNMSFDAFGDLAQALGIEDKDVSLGGKLGIAYGARGSGLAVAHFEPLANVIDLTRLKGAGSLAHEWGHALDHYYAEMLKTAEPLSHNSKFATLDAALTQGDSVIHDVVKVMRYQDDGVTPSKFYEDAKQLDKDYSIAGNQSRQHYSGNVEMFARSFAAYVYDKIRAKDGLSDYLIGHANHNAPTGDDRTRIFAALDKLIEELKKEGVLHARPVVAQKEELTPETEQEEAAPPTPWILEGEGYAQISLFDEDNCNATLAADLGMNKEPLGIKFKDCIDAKDKFTLSANSDAILFPMEMWDEQQLELYNRSELKDRLGISSAEFIDMLAIDFIHVKTYGVLHQDGTASVLLSINGNAETDVKLLPQEQASLIEDMSRAAEYKHSKLSDLLKSIGGDPNKDDFDKAADRGDSIDRE